MQDTRIIVSETRHDRDWAHWARRFDSPQAFVSSISVMAAFENKAVSSVAEALAYLDQRLNQRTRIITFEEFRHTQLADWDFIVGEIALGLGWVKTTYGVSA
jgi:hypothetical protein